MADYDPSHQSYLQGMGIQAWVLRDDCVAGRLSSGEAITEHDAQPVSLVSPEPTDLTGKTAEESLPDNAPEPQSVSREVPEIKTRNKTADVMPSTQLPNPPVVKVSGSHAPEKDREGIDRSQDELIATSGWKDLQARVRHCTACELHSARTQTVFGTGSQQADWLIVGEAPGAEEDKQGEPFVGSAGQLLTRMLLAIGLPRHQVYIANILKCRPPGNRDPRPAEVGQCQAFLDRQIDLLQPKIILAVGRIAAHNLLKTDEPLGRLRGKAYSYQTRDGQHEIPLVVTYHPAYLLRSPKEKRKSWQDLQYAVAVSQEKTS